MKFKIKQKLNLGLSNSTFIDENNNFVRYSNSLTDQFFNRPNEINVLKNIQAQFEQTIKIIDFGYDNNNFYVVSKYQNNLKHINEIAVNDQVIDKLLLTIKKFHQIEIKHPVEIFDYEKYLFWFYKKIKNQINNKITLEKIDKCLTKLRKIPMNIVLSHQDLVPGNILIINNEIQLIDFEFSYLNDKWFDYASLISESFKNDPQYKKIIFAKLKISENEINIIEQWIQYQNILWSLWSNYLFQETNQEIYREIYFEKTQNI